MTIREFLAALAAFFVLYILFVAAVIAAPNWKREVGIASWCHDLMTIRGIVEADASGYPKVADGLAVRAFQAGRCVRLPLAVAAFRPSGIAAEFPSFRERRVTVLKGNLVMRDETLGRQVFVVVPSHKLDAFRLGDEVDSRERHLVSAAAQDV